MVNLEGAENRCAAFFVSPFFSFHRVRNSETRIGPLQYGRPVSVERATVSPAREK